MEQRLIDGNALLEEINAQRMASMGSFPRRYYVVGDALNSIRNAPTVDAVEVVRCEDCKHYKYRWETDDGKGHGICDHSTQHLLDDSFCSYGERKSDG